MYFCAHAVLHAAADLLHFAVCSHQRMSFHLTEHVAVGQLRLQQCRQGHDWEGLQDTRRNESAPRYNIQEQNEREVSATPNAFCCYAKYWSQRMLGCLLWRRWRWHCKTSADFSMFYWGSHLFVFLRVCFSLRNWQLSCWLLRKSVLWKICQASLLVLSTVHFIVVGNESSYYNVTLWNMYRFGSAILKLCLVFFSFTEDLAFLNVL